MADWFVSSAAYAAVPAWAASTAYTVGQFVKPTAPAAGKEYAFRVTTAGTSGSTEPTWPANNGTTVTGGATFTNVSGQSTYNWSAPAGTLYSLCAANRTAAAAAGDRIFVSSDHSENISTATIYALTAAGFGLLQVVSVNRAGAVPPGASDILNGAALTTTIVGTQSMTLDALCDVFWQGITFTVAGAPTAAAILSFSNGGRKMHYFANCAFALTATATGGLIGNGATGVVKIVMDNTTVRFGAVGQYIGCSSAGELDLQWINTASAIQGATVPTNLFSTSSTGSNVITCRGVDLSAATGTLLAAGTACMNKVLLDSCRIASAATRLGTASSSNCASDEIELVNCYDGTNVINERYTPAGAVTTDRSTTLSGGAQDDIGNYSLKLASSTRSDFAALPLESFWIDVGNTATGSSKTATVEIISSGSLNNTDIRLLLEYMGTSGSPIASFGDTLASVLTSASALPTSSVTWNNPPGTPVKQYLRVTFTPQRAGRVRGLVRLGKISTTIWVDPRITIA